MNSNASPSENALMLGWLTGTNSEIHNTGSWFPKSPVLTATAWRRLFGLGGEMRKVPWFKVMRYLYYEW